MILNSVELWFVKANPKRPNNKFNKKNPTWECQIRTTDKAKKKAWEEAGLQVKAVLPDDDTPPFYRVNLRKKSIKTSDEPSSPVIVVNGARQPLDPDTIGNGSIGNVRVFQYEYTKETGGKGLASVLMGIQVTKHIVYKPKVRDDDFGDAETETVGSLDDEPSDEPGEAGEDADRY